MPGGSRWTIEDTSVILAVIAATVFVLLMYWGQDLTSVPNPIPPYDVALYLILMRSIIAVALLFGIFIWIALLGLRDASVVFNDGS